MKRDNMNGRNDNGMRQRSNREKKRVKKNSEQGEKNRKWYDTCNSREGENGKE